MTDSDGNLYLVGAWRERLDEGHRRWLTGVDDARSPVTTGPGTSGPRLLWPTESLPAGFAGLTDPYTAARPFVADKDKVTRARTLAARYEAGKVYHLRTAPGLEAFEAEAVAFPNGRNDDLVDAAVYGADLNRANDFHFA